MAAIETRIDLRPQNFHPVERRARSFINILLFAGNHGKIWL